MGDPVVNVNPDYCIGCGLCVSTCPSNALTLTRKPLDETDNIPETLTDFWYNQTSRDQQ